jgi:peptidyl-prolyl cis-trans isomerase B (cyclophilin B)
VPPDRREVDSIDCATVSKASRRERQRQNRAARRAYEERRAKRQKTIRTGRRVAILAVPAIIAIVLVQVLSGGSSSSNTVACQTVKKPPVKNVKLTTPPVGISQAVNYVATMDTSCGTITIALNSQQYPTAVNNFVSLANQGFYNNMAFVRAAKDFVVQAGSPDQSNTTSNGGPGYSVQAEVPTTAPGGSAYPVGTVAFATGGSDPAGTASSQFFIVTGNQGLSLSPTYAIVGKVTKGLNVAQKIDSFAPANGDGPPTTEVVIKSVRITTPTAASTTSTPSSTPPSS